MYILAVVAVVADTLVVPAVLVVLAVVVLEHRILPLVEHLIPVVAEVDLVVQVPIQVTELLAVEEAVLLSFVIQTHMPLLRPQQDRVLLC
jgi:hypothetical protein